MGMAGRFRLISASISYRVGARPLLAAQAAQQACRRFSGHSPSGVGRVCITDFIRHTAITRRYFMTPMPT